MGMFEGMLGGFKKKENKTNPYADLHEDIAEQTGDGIVTKREGEEFAINEDNQLAMEAMEKSPEKLN